MSLIKVWQRMSGDYLALVDPQYVPIDPPSSLVQGPLHDIPSLVSVVPQLGVISFCRAESFCLTYMDIGMMLPTFRDVLKLVPGHQTCPRVFS